MAAGLGFKTFTTGEVLTSADTNGYLMQGVLVFASAAARDASITSPQEGQFAYLKDTNVTTYYTGSAWTNLDTTGMTNPMTTTGDMVYSSSGSTPARLGIGTTGQVVTVAAGIPSWATPAGGGKVLQMVTATTTTSTQSATTTYVDTTLTATITPTLNTSTILVMVAQNGVSKNTSDTGAAIKLFRGATEISLLVLGAGQNSTSGYNGSYTIATNFKDSPATTSATTYKTQFMSISNGSVVKVQNDSAMSTIVLMEIGA